MPSRRCWRWRSTIGRNSPVENIPAPGRGIAASIKSQLWNMQMGNFITEYEAEMGTIIAQVMCGGDVNPGHPDH